MKYPIDAEEYIEAMRLEFGPNKSAEEAHREIIPFVNSCYEDGLRGESGYPLELGEELQAFAAATGKDLDKLKNNPLIPPMIAWCNRAYEQGRKEATNEDPHGAPRRSL